jgi:hypothetical protein
MQLAYREGAAVRRAEINTPTAAYYAIQAYLSLCLPPTIEAKLAEHIATMRAFPDPATRGSGAAFGITLTSPTVTRPEIRADVGAGGGEVGPGPGPGAGQFGPGPRQGPVIRSTEPAPKTASLSPAQTILNPKTDVERTISRANGKAFQKTLCLPETGDFDATTRTALRDFFSAVLYPTDANPPDSVGIDAELRHLRDAQATFPSCKGAGFVSPYEVGVFYINGSEQVRLWLVAALKNAQLPVPAALNATATGAGMNKAMRDAVEALRPKLGLSGKPVIDRDFFVKWMNSISR